MIAIMRTHTGLETLIQKAKEWREESKMTVHIAGGVTSEMVREKLILALKSAIED